MAFESRFFADHQGEEGSAKLPSASIRSPATVCAVNELGSVFRVSGDAIRRGSPSANDRHATGAGNSAGRRRRGRAPRFAPSFPLDGEASTSSDDTDDGERPSAAIFRPARGAKRRCAAPEHRRDPARPAKRRACGPALLRRANPVGGDEEERQARAAPCHTFALPFPRVCRGNGFASATSPFTALFMDAAASPATNIHRRGDTLLSNAPLLLQHPLTNLNLLQALFADTAALSNVPE